SGNGNDIVYDQSTGLWACCYSDDYVDCKVPTDYTFQAPAPEDLRRLVSSSSTSSSAAATSASVISPSSLPSTSSASLPPLTAEPSPVASNDNNSLGSGAKAGIGVGVALAVLLLIAALFFVWRRRRRQKSSGGVTEKPASALQGVPGKTLPVQEVDAEQQRELDSRAYFEMNGQSRGKNNVQEMG
ncbi:MAG: hypothetical protein Q9174_006297, partial [Haloplaca sp. 1 TL-2023]